MKKKEISDMIYTLMGAYPGAYRVADMEFTINLYHRYFGEYDGAEVAIAVDRIISTQKKAPAIADIIDAIHSTREAAKPEADEGKAWALVRKATAGNMEFSKLPEEIQMAVGSAKQIEEWGRAENMNWEVVQSNFLRAYRQVLNRKKEDARIPESVRNVIRLATANMNQIEVKDGM